MVEILCQQNLGDERFFWPTDEQLARLSLFFPKSNDRPRADDSRMRSGIIFINRNGLRGGMRREMIALQRRSITAGLTASACDRPVIDSRFFA